jgi:hypothetical protein
LLVDTEQLAELPARDLLQRRARRTMRRPRTRAARPSPRPRIGAQHAHQVDAIGCRLGSRILRPARRAIVETPPARELD